jgi:uncharacterized membrane protein
MSQRRLVAIDATRGTAMLFVFLSHFALSYVRLSGATDLFLMINRIGMVASPTFMLVSGIVLGYLHETHRENFGPVKEMLIGRGLFLLTVGRVLIIIAHVPFTGGLQPALSWLFMTDTIGFCVIVGALLIDYLKPSLRLLIAFSLFLLSWWMMLAWIPNESILLAVKDLVFGPIEGNDGKIYADVFPLMPWLSLYVFGSYVGSRMGGLQIRDRLASASGFVARVAVAVFALVAIILAFRSCIDEVNPSGLGLILSYHMHIRKLPPTLLYFLFYGGVGLIILYIFLRFEANPLIRGISRFTQVLGQVSLFVFIAQYYVYFSLFVLLQLEYSVLWPLYFAVSVIAIYVPSKLWFTHGLNRYLTVPYMWLINRAKRLVVNRH